MYYKYNILFVFKTRKFIAIFNEIKELIIMMVNVVMINNYIKLWYLIYKFNNTVGPQNNVLIHSRGVAVV